MIDVVIPTRDPQNALKAFDSCKEWAASVTIVTRPEWGFTQQVESGWRGGKADFVLFLNDDCVMNEDAMRQMLGAMGDKEVGIVGPTLKCGDYQSTETNAPQEDGEYPLYITVRHLIGACMLVRRSMLTRLGGWNVNLKLHCSDLALCIEAWGQGFKCVWAIQAKVEHASRQTLDEAPEQEIKEIMAADHWRFVQIYPHEELSKDGVITLRGFKKGYQVVYPKDIEEQQKALAATQKIAGY